MRYALALALLTMACDDDGPAPVETDAEISDPGGLDAASDADRPEPDVDPPDPDADPPDAAPDGAPPPESYCEGVGQPAEPLREGDGFLFGDTAGDFTAQTLGGPWTLSERWSGCESYVFLVYIPDLRQRPGDGWDGDQLWESDPLALVREGGRNVHYFFVSLEESVLDRLPRMEAMKQEIDLALAFEVPPEDAAHWRSRFHYVTDRATEVEGSVGGWASDYLAYAFDAANRVDLGDRGQAPPPLPFAFAIGRDQRWDPVGNLNEIVGAPPIWAMAAYASTFFDYRAGLRERLAAEAAETAEVVLFDDIEPGGGVPVTATLPDAGTMADFDTLEIDVAVNCAARNVFACGEWDAVARVDWCADAECAERWELVRWITPYWRRGERRWVMDASPLLALLDAGGEQHFRLELGQPGQALTTARVALRLRTTGVPRSIGVARAFTGGAVGAADNHPAPPPLTPPPGGPRGGPRSFGVPGAFPGGAFGADNNDREPLVFTPAAGASRVELAVIVTGHGQGGANNCAEWCDHRHQFAINGVALPEIRPTEALGDIRGCARRVGDGQPPGQWGNWAPGRAYWCPGLPVDTLRFDLTEHLELGAESALTYRGNFEGGEPQGGNVLLNSYIVSYR